ncbi:hypothetical protein MM300_07000 [Evansella sp. LMS18]|uniref:tetratricopeptide repeat protein n=1 Tax=Evansella sp. LMS18 TaxID=2924033 RepID=UPI0020D1F295|nr:hypothetical protein [Evansella sp. LMS18]UTR12032.1 hypothetical protein MM300_07000 [Evansella sp. LMS18]
MRIPINGAFVYLLAVLLLAACSEETDAEQAEAEQNEKAEQNAEVKQNEEAEQTEAERIEEIVASAEAFAFEGNYREATLAYEEVIKLEPENEQFYLRLGEIYVSAEEDDLVVETIRSGIKNVKETLRLREFLADFYLKKERYSEAENIFKEMVEDDIGRLSGIEALVDLYEYQESEEKLMDFLPKAYKMTGNTVYQDMLDQILTFNAGELLDGYDKNKASFATKMRDKHGNSYNVFFYSDNEETSMLDEPSPFGHAGDLILKGDYRAVVQNEQTGEYYKQEVIMENMTINTNIGRPYVVENSPDLLVFGWVEAQNVNVVDIYALTDDGLKNVAAFSSFDAVVKQTGPNKFLVVNYNNVDWIWTFTTMKLDVDNWTMKKVEEVEYDFDVGEEIYNAFSGDKTGINYVQDLEGNAVVAEEENWKEEEREEETEEETQQEEGEGAYSYLRELLNYVGKGILGEEFATIGSTPDDLIHSFGSPVEIWEDRGGYRYIFDHGDYMVGFNGDGSEIVIGMTLYPINHIKDQITYQLVIDVLGLPESEGFNELDLTHMLSYNINNHRLHFHFEDSSEGTPVKWIELF